MTRTLVERAYQGIMYCRDPRPQGYDEDYITLPMAVAVAGQPAVAYGFCDSFDDGEDNFAVYTPRVVATWRVVDGAVAWMPADNLVAGLQLGPEQELVNLAPALDSPDPMQARADYGALLSDLLVDTELARRVVGGASASSPLLEPLRQAFDRSAETALLPFYGALAPQYMRWLRR